MTRGLVQLSAAALAAALATSSPSGDEYSAAEVRRILQHSPLPELPGSSSAVADDPAAARLGQFLFFEKRLSLNGDVSCAACHEPSRAFTDGKPVAEGAGRTDRNTMSLLNTAFNRWYFWDGRADSLWAQALQPIEHPAEMASSRLAAVRLIADDPSLRRAYESIFGPLPDLSDPGRFPLHARPVPDEPDDPWHLAWSAMDPDDRAAIDRAYSNIGKAIEAYERRLISRRSAFDRFAEGLRAGDAQAMAALSPEAQRGLRLFIGKGECRLCHSGPNFSDGEFHDIRVPPAGGGMPLAPGRYDGIARLRSDPFNTVGAFSDDREGPAAQRLRFLASGPQFWGAFKTPSLRNVALTAPYMHQGQFATLEAVLHYYSTLEAAVRSDHHDETILVPRQFTEQEKADLIEFLKSLSDTDSLDPALLVPPPSP